MGLLRDFGNQNFAKVRFQLNYLCLLSNTCPGLTRKTRPPAGPRSGSAWTSGRPAWSRWRCPWCRGRCPGPRSAPHPASHWTRLKLFIIVVLSCKVTSPNQYCIVLCFLVLSAYWRNPVLCYIYSIWPLPVAELVWNYPHSMVNLHSPQIFSWCPNIFLPLDTCQVLVCSFVVLARLPPSLHIENVQGRESSGGSSKRPQF